MNYLLLILGALLMLVIKFHIAQFKKDFKVSIFLKKNGLAAIANILVGTIFILANVEVKYYLFGIDMNLLFWAFIGNMGQFVWRKTVKKLADKFSGD